MAQAEKQKLLQNVFAKRLEQFDEIGDQLRHSFAKQPFEFLARMKSEAGGPYLDEFVKQLDIDLNSFYLCEQVTDTAVVKSEASERPSLVKINKLDALAFFDSTQLFDRFAEHLFDADPVGLCQLNTQTKVTISDKLYFYFVVRFRTILLMYLSVCLSVIFTQISIN